MVKEIKFAERTSIWIHSLDSGQQSVQCCVLADTLVVNARREYGSIVVLIQKTDEDLRHTGEDAVRCDDLKMMQGLGLVVEGPGRADKS